MLLALATTAIVALALLWDALAPRAGEALARRRARRRVVSIEALDPGRERRAEARARQLLRSCVDDEDWAMYRELGFLRVWGARTRRPDEEDDVPAGTPYAYLIYPHKPILAYVPQTGRLLHEYCVTFPDRTRPYGSERLPDADDVLAKWMALTGDERRLIETANLHLPGRQLDPRVVERDLWRLRRWERARAGSHAAAEEAPGGRVPAP